MSIIIKNIHKCGNYVCKANALIKLSETFVRIFRTIMQISVINVDSSNNNSDDNKEEKQSDDNSNSTSESQSNSNEDGDSNEEGNGNNP